jgi:hypothetical protein
VRRIYQIAERALPHARLARRHRFFRNAGARLALLAQMDELRSRYRLEGRYHHVLVDEFQTPAARSGRWWRC